MFCFVEVDLPFLVSFVWFAYHIQGLLLTGITFNIIPACISNYIPYNVRGRITFPFLNFNGLSIEMCEWMNNFIPHFTRFVVTDLYRD